MIRPRALSLRLLLVGLLLGFASAVRVAAAAPEEPTEKTPAPAQPADHPEASVAKETKDGPAAAPSSEAAVAPAPPPVASSVVAPPAPDGPPVPQPAASVAKPTPVHQHATDEIHGLLNLGASLTDRGDYDAAEIAFRQVLNARTVAPFDTRTALLGLARMHRKKSEYTKAVAIYERFLKDNPGDERTPDALLDLGRTLRALGVYKIAISRFYSVLNCPLTLAGDSFERYQVLAKTAQFEIAQTYFESGDYTEAGKFFTRLRLLDLAPGDRARAHFMCAYSQRNQGDLDAAVATLRAFIEQTPDDSNVPEARYLLAISLRELKRPQEAFAATLDLLRAEKSRVAADPKVWIYWQRRTGNQLANDFFENGDTLNAQAIYRSLIDMSPEPTWRIPLTYQVGLCCERLGDLPSARSSFQSVVDLAAKAPSPDLAELVRMAAWRIEQLSWRENVDKQVSAFFDSTTGKTVSTVPSPSVAQKTAATP